MWTGVDELWREEALVKESGNLMLERENVTRSAGWKMRPGGRVVRPVMNTGWRLRPGGRVVRPVVSAGWRRWPVVNTGWRMWPVVSTGWRIRPGARVEECDERRRETTWIFSQFTQPPFVNQDPWSISQKGATLLVTISLSTLPPGLYIQRRRPPWSLFTKETSLPLVFIYREDPLVFIYRGGPSMALSDGRYNIPFHSQPGPRSWLGSSVVLSCIEAGSRAHFAHPQSGHLAFFALATYPSFASKQDRERTSQIYRGIIRPSLPWDMRQRPDKNWTTYGEKSRKEIGGGLG